MAKKYMIDDEEVEESEFWDTLRDEVESYVDDNIDDIIDSDNEEIHIGSMTFFPSQVLKEIDPIAYSCYKDDVVEQEYDDLNYDLENGGEEEVNGKAFKVEDEEE